MLLDAAHFRHKIWHASFPRFSGNFVKDTSSIAVVPHIFITDPPWFSCQQYERPSPGEWTLRPHIPPVYGWKKFIISSQSAPRALPASQYIQHLLIFPPSCNPASCAQTKNILKNCIFHRKLSRVRRNKRVEQSAGTLSFIFRAKR